MEIVLQTITYNSCHVLTLDEVTYKVTPPRLHAQNQAFSCSASAKVVIPQVSKESDFLLPHVSSFTESVNTKSVRLIQLA